MALIETTEEEWARIITEDMPDVEAAAAREAAGCVVDQHGRLIGLPAREEAV